MSLMYTEATFFFFFINWLLLFFYKSRQYFQFGVSCVLSEREKKKKCFSELIIKDERGGISGGLNGAAMKEKSFSLFLVMRNGLFLSFSFKKWQNNETKNRRWFVL